MDQGDIGIRLADSSFYAILKQEERKKKKVILTTVRDGQESVRIDLYKNIDSDYPDYLGSVVIEHISELPKGEPEIELIISLGDDDELTASAKDLKSDNAQSLHLFLNDSASDEEFDMPDFEIDDTFHQQSAHEHVQLYSAAQESAHFVEEGESNPASLIIPIVVVGAVVIGLLLVLLNFFFNPGPGAAADANATATASPVVEQRETPVTGSVTTPVVEETEVPVIARVETPMSRKTATPVSRKTETPVVERRETPGIAVSDAPAAVISPVAADSAATPLPEMTLNVNGVPYLIRPGDTLWGLAYSFYKDPRLYWKIFAENNISDPDLLFPGQEVVVPRD